MKCRKCGRVLAEDYPVTYCDSCWELIYPKKEALEMEDFKSESIFVYRNNETKQFEMIFEGRNTIYNHPIHFREAEKLKDWLEEAIKPRYVVKNRNAGDWDVWDSEKDKRMARYYTQNFLKLENINAKEEAERLCERLNREC